MASVNLNTKGLEAGFGVRHMTIFNWRGGSATRDALPCSISEAKRVTFTLAKVKAWAKKYDLAFDEAKAIKATEDANAVVPGPKPAPAKKASKVRPSVKAKFAKGAKLVEAATKSQAKRKAIQAGAAT